jgi:hypothetical protein
MDFTWVTPTDQTPLTTKGDLFAFSTVDARLPAGANETRLVADSAQTLGLKYVADTTNYAIAAKADLLVGTAADTLAALTVGTNGQVLTADSTVSPTGLKWATPSAGGGGKVLQVVMGTTGTPVASATSTFVDSNLTANITCSAATSKVLVLVSQKVTKNNANSSTMMSMRLVRSGTTIFTPDTSMMETASALLQQQTFSMNYLDEPASTSALTYKTQFCSTQNNSQVLCQADTATAYAYSQIILMEIGA